MSQGSVDSVIGAQDGDEGKAKITDKFNSKGLDIVLPTRGHIQRVYQVGTRGNGGGNAGHTIKFIDRLGNVQTVKSHAVPSAAVVPHMDLYIGSGCVVDPIGLCREVDELNEKGLAVDARLRISPLATTVSPIDLLVDRLHGGAIGTTGSGIGPAYTNQAIRGDELGITNIRLAEATVFDPKDLQGLLIKRWQVVYEEMRRNIDEAKVLRAYRKYFNKDAESKPAALNAIKSKVLKDIQAYLKCVARMKKAGWVLKDIGWINDKLHSGANVLAEGAQAIGIGKTTAPVPFGTSSNTTPADLRAGCDISPEFDGVNCFVFKAIPTRVGNGPFPGEFGGRRSEEYCANPKVTKATEAQEYDMRECLRSTDEFLMGIGARQEGDEYGVTSGRPRREGAFNMVAASHNARAFGATFLAVTKVDSLRVFADTPATNNRVPFVTDYADARGARLDRYPYTAQELYAVRPVMDSMPSFTEDISGVRDNESLPPNAEEFIRMLEARTQRPVVFAGTGPERSQLRKRM